MVRSQVCESVYSQVKLFINTLWMLQEQGPRCWYLLRPFLECPFSSPSFTLCVDVRSYRMYINTILFTSHDSLVHVPRRRTSVPSVPLLSDGRTRETTVEQSRRFKLFHLITFKLRVSHRGVQTPDTNWSVTRSMRRIVRQ